MDKNSKSGSRVRTVECHRIFSYTNRGLTSRRAVTFILFVAETPAPAHLAQFEGLVIAEPLELQVSSYTSCSNRQKTGTQTHFYTRSINS